MSRTGNGRSTSAGGAVSLFLCSWTGPALIGGHEGPVDILGQQTSFQTVCPLSPTRAVHSLAKVLLQRTGLGGDGVWRRCSQTGTTIPYLLAHACGISLPQRPA